MASLEDRGRAVDRFELVDVRTYAFQAEARDGSRHPEALPPAPASPGHLDLGTSVDLTLDPENGQAEVRVSALFGLDETAVMVDLGARFTDRDPQVEPDGDLRGALAAIAVELLYPYMREAVAAATTRLDKPVTLGLLKIGGMTVEPT